MTFKIETPHQWHEIEKARIIEMKRCNAEGISLCEGTIGVESLGLNDGYAYPALGGFGNMASYVCYNEYMPELRRTAHLKGR